MRNIREFSREELAAGAECPKCGLLFFDRTALDIVRLADAALLFCPSCKANVGVLLDRCTDDDLEAASA